MDNNDFGPSMLLSVNNMLVTTQVYHSSLGVSEIIKV